MAFNSLEFLQSTLAALGGYVKDRSTLDVMTESHIFYSSMVKYDAHLTERQRKGLQEQYSYIMNKGGNVLLN